MLSYDICRCTNKKCPLPCRRKEPSDGLNQSYARFRAINGKCEMQIKLEVENETK